MQGEHHKTRRTILICGGGISGLASALFVARAGYRVEVFEQAEHFDPIGAGLQLSPNAMQVLAGLGLDRQIKTVASAPLAIDVRDYQSNRTIAKIPLGLPVIEQYGQPYLVVHRADLQQILATACQQHPDIEIRMGARIRDAVSHPNGISVIVDHNSQTRNFTCAALIGADGVNSVIRNECFAGGPAKSTGTVALRALVRMDQLPQSFRDRNIRMWLANDVHAVAYPVRAQQYQNIIITVGEKFIQSANEVNSVFQQRINGTMIAERLEGWCDAFKYLLDANTTWTHWPLFAAPSLKTWQEGCIVLIGDAAHAMTPHAAQGAAMGLEDAGVLGWALSRNSSIETAFSQYQNERMKRVGDVQKLSRKNKVIYQLPAGLSHLRNLGMRVIGGQKLLQRQDWIYKWKLPSA